MDVEQRHMSRHKDWISSATDAYHDVASRKEHALQASWDGIASDVDRNQGDNGTLYRQFVYDPSMWKLVGNPTGLDVLDAGCGNGYIAQQLAEKAHTVVGIDSSLAMIIHAKARRKRPNVYYSQASIDSLPIRDVSIDLVISNSVLSCVNDLHGPAQEFSRVVRPGGSVIIGIDHPIMMAVYKTQEEAGLSADGVDKTLGYFEREPYRTTYEEAPFYLFNRPLMDYTDAFLRNGFVVTGFLETEVTETAVGLMSEKVPSIREQLLHQKGKPANALMKFAKPR